MPNEARTDLRRELVQLRGHINDALLQLDQRSPNYPDIRHDLNCIAAARGHICSLLDVLDPRHHEGAAQNSQ